MLNEERKGYIGNPAQLALVRRVTVAEGKAKGTGIIEVRTAGGLELDILPDSGLDIGQCRFRGMTMSWMSKNGYDSPVTDLPYENEFLNTFPGGLLYTCGLRNAGPANRDGEEWHPLHGRRDPGDGAVRAGDGTPAADPHPGLRQFGHGGGYGDEPDPAG